MWRDLNTTISQQDTLFAGSHSEVREADLGPLGGAGRVDSAHDWTVSSPLRDRPLQERDLSLGFGASSAHTPQEGNELWIRNCGYVGAAEGNGAEIPGGLAWRQDIVREIAERAGAEFGVGAPPCVGGRREARGADEGRASFVAYVGGEGRVHLGSNGEESGSESGDRPVSGKGKAADEEGAPVHGGIWGNTVLREEGASDSFKWQKLDVSVSTRSMELVEPLSEVRPGDFRVEQSNEDGGDHSLQLHDPNQVKPAPQAQPGVRVSPGIRGGTTCLECGNHAKRDCLHQRCRTCCKNRGLECLTHIRSTWVPAAERRERQAAEAAAAAAFGQPRPMSKRSRNLAFSAPANSTNAPPVTSPRDSDVNSGQQAKDILPHEVRVPTVFKCVRVTGVDNEEIQLAYQASVKIGGHIFKGILYDTDCTRDI